MRSKLCKLLFGAFLLFGVVFVCAPSTAKAASDATIVTIANHEMSTTSGVTYLKNDFSAGTASDYNFYFNGKGQLTLKNAKIDAFLQLGSTAKFSSLEANGNLTITLIGTNVISATENNGFGEVGGVNLSFVNCAGNLVVQGEGSLEVKANEVVSYYGFSAGLFAENVQIKGTTVTVHLGTSGSGKNVGIYSDGYVIIYNSKIVADPGTLKVTEDYTYDPEVMTIGIRAAKNIAIAFSNVLAYSDQYSAELKQIGMAIRSDSGLLTSNQESYLAGTEKNKINIAASVGDYLTGKAIMYTGTDNVKYYAPYVSLTDTSAAAKITEQPEDVQAIKGSTNAKFSVKATGSPAVTYQWMQYKNSRWVKINNATKSTYTVKKVIKDMTLRCVVTNKTTQTNTVTSDQVKLVVVTKQLGRVTGLKVTDIAAKKLSLTWKKLKGAAAYTIYYRDSKTKKYEVYKTNVKDTKCTVSSLTPKTKYYFYVVGYNKYARGFKSAIRKGTTLAEEPMTFTLTKESNTTIRVKWTSVKGAFGYQIANNHTHTGEFEIKHTSYFFSHSYLSLYKEGSHTYKYRMRYFTIKNGKRVYSRWTSVKKITI